jgi:ABC-2 type transport system permease protein
MVYQMCIFNGYPLQEAWLYFAFLALFIMLPLLVMRNLRRAMIEYVYIP